MRTGATIHVPQTHTKERWTCDRLDNRPGPRPVPPRSSVQPSQHRGSRLPHCCNARPEGPYHHTSKCRWLARRELPRACTLSAAASSYHYSATDKRLREVCSVMGDIQAGGLVRGRSMSNDSHFSAIFALSTPRTSTKLRTLSHHPPRSHNPTAQGPAWNDTHARHPGPIRHNPHTRLPARGRYSPRQS